MTLKFLSPSEHVASSVTYVRDQDGQVYARVPVYTAYDSSTVAGSKVVSIHGPEFAMWINDTVRRQGQGSVPKSFVKDVVNTAELIASYNSVKQETCVRVGKVGDSYYIDMGDDTGRAIKVEPGKWSIVPSAPIMFVRSPNDEPMREPLAPGQGNVNDLFKVVNVAPADHNFLIVWLIEAFRTDTTFPILHLRATSQSGKSTLHRTISKIVELNKYPFSDETRIDDMRVSLKSRYVLSLNNLSEIDPAVSDFLCTIAVDGGGGGKRNHGSYSTMDTTSFMRPIILNGIPSSLITRDDLLTRTLRLELPSLGDVGDEGKRTPDTELAFRFANLYPSIMGGLLDLFANALTHVPSIRSQHKQATRFGDFEVLGEAVGRVRGAPADEFTASFVEKMLTGTSSVVEDDPVAVLLINYVVRWGVDKRHKMSVGDLMNKCRPHATGTAKADTSSPRKFRVALDRVSTSLNKIGLVVTIPESRVNGVRQVSLEIRPGSDVTKYEKVVEAFAVIEKKRQEVLAQERARAEEKQRMAQKEREPLREVMEAARRLRQQQAAKKEAKKEEEATQSDT